MAECASDVQNVTDGKWLSDKLNCPICLEVYTSPRSLMCLHTFCERCIHEYIVSRAEKGSSQTTIECPLCRGPTVPSFPNKPPAQWAQGLPVNYALLPMLNSVDAVVENESRNKCDACKRVQQTNSAVAFCTTCREYQCENCVECHARFPMTKDHNILKAADMKSELVNLGKIEFCPSHTTKEIEFYCEDHGVMCCSTCAIVTHRPCRKVSEVKTMGRDVKEENKTLKLQTEMDSLQDQLKKLADAIETNITEIDKQVDVIPQKVKEIRDKIVHVLDTLVVKVSSDCHQLKKENSTKLSDQIFNCKSLIAAVASSGTLLASVLEHGTEAQIFITFHKVEEQLKEYRQRVKEMFANTSAIEISLDVSKDLETLSQSSPSLAKVCLKQGKHNIKYKPTTIPIADCKMEMMPLVDVKLKKGSKQPCYCRIGCLPNGLLVAADYRSSCLCLLYQDTTVITMVNLPSKPLGIAVLGSSEVVVALSENQLLQRITVDTQPFFVGSKLSLDKTIQCPRKPMCLSSIDHQQMAVGYEVGFGIIALDGKEKTYLERDASGRVISFTQLCGIAVDMSRSQVYQSSSQDSVIYCFQLTGEPVFAYNRKLSQPRGVALDPDGNVYIPVHSRDTSTVHQLSPAGSVINILDTGMIGGPNGICFHSIDGSERCRMILMNWKYNFSADYLGCVSTQMLKVNFQPPVNDG